MPKKPFLDPLDALARLFNRFGKRGVVIGGIAVGLLSKTRFTEDLDAMVLLSVEDVPVFLEKAKEEGIIPRIDDAEKFAKRNRVLLLRHAPSQTDIDISLGVLPFEEEVVQRSILHKVDKSLSIRLPTPEDLIIMKAIAHRPKDLLDIQEIIRSNPALDKDRIESRVRQFADFLEIPALWDDIAEWL